MEIDSLQHTMLHTSLEFGEGSRQQRTEVDSRVHFEGFSGELGLGDSDQQQTDRQRRGIGSQYMHGKQRQGARARKQEGGERNKNTIVSMNKPSCAGRIQGWLELAGASLRFMTGLRRQRPGRAA